MQSPCRICRLLFLLRVRGLNLKHVDSMYIEPNVKPWQSSSWVPEGHKSRNDTAFKEEQVTGMDVTDNVGTGYFAHEETFYDPRPSQACADTQVGGVEKMSCEAPQTNRGNLEV